MRNFYMVSELECWSAVWDNKEENYSVLIFHLETSSKLIFHKQQFYLYYNNAIFSVLGQHDVIGIEGGG